MVRARTQSNRSSVVRDYTSQNRSSQTHGASSVVHAGSSTAGPLCSCAARSASQVKAILSNCRTAYRSHSVRAQRFSYHDAFSTRTHGEHRSRLGTSYHCSCGAVMHEMDELLEICVDVSTGPGSMHTIPFVSNTVPLLTGCATRCSFPSSSSSTPRRTTSNPFRFKTSMFSTAKISSAAVNSKGSGLPRLNQSFHYANTHHPPKKPL